MGQTGEPRDANAANALLDRNLTAPELVSEYQKRREELVAAERAGAWDARARASASNREVDASSIVQCIREHERNVLFGNVPSEAIPAEGTLEMGGKFLANKARIERESKVYQMARRMPKGALLHVHFNAELDPERLLEQARKMDNMFLRSTRPLLSVEDLDRAELVFHVLPADTPSANVFSPAYQPLGHGDHVRCWMKWTSFRAEFHTRHGARYRPEAPPRDGVPNSCEAAPVCLCPAESWIRQKMALSLADAYAIDQTVNGCAPSKCCTVADPPASGRASTKRRAASKACSTTSPSSSGTLEKPSKT